MANGTVKWFNAKKGFGFITPEVEGDDVFMHFSQLVMEGFKTIDEGQKVSYTLTKSDKGWVASDVHKVD